MSPVMFTIAGFSVRWYSVLIMVGVFLAYVIFNSECNKFKYNKELVFNLMFWAIIFGIIGARLYYVVFNLDYYGSNLSEIYKIWNGGLAIHGGLLFGLITIIIYCKKYKVNYLKILDMCVPAVILAQGIGRWGNFFNSEAYGSVVSYQSLVNLKIIPSFIIDNMYINGAYHLPMFYFESIICVLGFIIMLIIRRCKYIKTGSIVSFYLIWYGAFRFVIELFREDSLMILGAKVACIVSAIMILSGVIILIIQNRKPKLESLYNKIEDDIKF